MTTTTNETGTEGNEDGMTMGEVLYEPNDL
jgi:hypothetical protein